MVAKMEKFDDRPVLADALRELAPLPLDAARVVSALHMLLDYGHGRLPSPGAGHTLERWQALAKVAGTDLCLLKLYEGHTDAMAILDELGASSSAGVWGVWAAEVPGLEVVFKADGKGSEGRLFGTRAWCSGGADVDHALITAHAGQEDSILVHVPMRQPGIRRDLRSWKAVGMAATGTGEVIFDGAVGYRIGKPGQYVRRPGFCHGSIGIAACWYGAACAIANTLRNSPRLSEDVHAQTHLGAMDAQLFAACCALRTAAARIDAHPHEDARLLALRVRAIVEAAAVKALDRVGRALGAGPLCADAEHARRCADLTTFLRQSHADRDLQRLGMRCAHAEPRLAEETVS